MSVWHQEEDMGARATRFALVFWMALAVAVIILAIKPWAGARDSESKSAAPIPAREIIYQPQYWKVFIENPAGHARRADVGGPKPLRARHASAEAVYDTVRA
jgi:hypothetical protein